MYDIERNYFTKLFYIKSSEYNNDHCLEVLPCRTVFLFCAHGQNLSFFQLVSLKLIFKYGGFRSSTNTSNAALFQLKVVDRAIMPGDAVRRTKFKNNGEYTPQRGFVKKVGSFQSPPPKFLKVNFPKKFRPV